MEKAGQIDAVILSAEHHQALLTHQDKAARAARKRAFKAEFAHGITAQNARFEALGIPHVVVVKSDLLGALATAIGALLSGV